MAIVKSDKYYEKQAEKYIDPYRKEALGDTLKLHQEKAQDTRKIYDEEIFEAGRAYNDQERENAVQKAISERQVAESMANLGLTDSGLNRTQQTAVQLSHANNKAAIDRQRLKDVTGLERQKAHDLSTIRQGWLSDKAAINQQYDSATADYATELRDQDVARYNKHLEEQTKQKKNELAYLSKKEKEAAKEAYIIKASGANLSRDFEGSLEDNGVTVRRNGDKTIYIDTKSGKSTTVSSTTNPYTGEDNAIKYSAIADYGYFDNGYQPRGVEGYGKFVAVEDQTDYRGRKQNVFVTVSNHQGPHYWLWNGGENRYMEVFVNEDGKWEEKVK